MFRSKTQISLVSLLLDFQVPRRASITVPSAPSSVAASSPGPSPANAVPAQASAGNPNAGLCNDDAGCGASGGFTSGLQSRTAGVLAAGTYYVSVGGCSTGAFTLRLQHIRQSIGSFF